MCLSPTQSINTSMPMLQLQPHHVQTSFVIRVEDGQIVGNGGFARLHPDLENYIADAGIEDFRVYVVTGGNFRTPFEVDLCQPLPPIQGVIKTIEIALSPSLNLADGFYFLSRPSDAGPWMDAYVGSDRTVYIDVENDLDASKLTLYL